MAQLSLDVLPPSDPRAASALYAFMEEMSTSYFGRPATEDDVRAGLKDFPSDDLQPPRGLLVVAHRDGAVAGCAGLRLVAADLVEARRLYERIGYREVPRFNDSRYAAHWFAKRLS